jgi:hypothetical protein
MQSACVSEWECVGALTGQIVQAVGLLTTAAYRDVRDIAVHVVPRADTPQVSFAVSSIIMEEDRTYSLRGVAVRDVDVDVPAGASQDPSCVSSLASAHYTLYLAGEWPEENTCGWQQLELTFEHGFVYLAGTDHESLPSVYVAAEGEVLRLFGTVAEINRHLALGVSLMTQPDFNSVATSITSRLSATI